MRRWSARRSSVLPSEGRLRAAGVVRRAAASVELLAVALWLGGLLALGAIAAPVVFARVALPSSADAMTVVFRRFDLVALASAAVVLLSEGAMFVVSGVASAPFTAYDRGRVAAGVAAGALAVVEATAVSPRIAALHEAGVLRGIGSQGVELARLHDLAEWCGKSEVVLLVAVVVLQVIAWAPITTSRGRPVTTAR
jgi:hypothetical protein